MKPWRSRRALVAGATALVVAGGAVLVATDPFKSTTPAQAGVVDNGYPISLQTVTRQSVTSTVAVSGTLGYAGSYSLAIPSGVAPAVVSADEATLQSAESKVSQDEAALATAGDLAASQNASTLLSARNTVAVDSAALDGARAELAADERLGCPAPSAATVGTATSASGSPSSSPSTPSSSPTTSGASESPGRSPAGATGANTAAAVTGTHGGHATLLAAFDAPPSAGSWRVRRAGAKTSGSTGATGGATGATGGATGATTGSNPSGGGTGATGGATGATTGSNPSGGGTSPASSSSPGSSTPETSASQPPNNAGGSPSAGVTTTTEPAPVAPAVTLAPPSASSGTASLAGTVDSGGITTTYRFEYGTSATYGSSTKAITLPAGSSTVAVSAELTHLRPATTYLVVLEATNAEGTVRSDPQTFQTSASSCAEQSQVVESDDVALTQAKYALSSDETVAGTSLTSQEQQLASDEQQVSADRQALAAARQQLTNPGTRFTDLPAPGQVVSRGKSVYSLDGRPVVLLYGDITPYRALYLDVSPGADVAELQQNLAALGFGEGLHADGDFGLATEAAVKAWQSALGMPATGVVSLGDVVVEPGAIRIETVSATLGAATSPGLAVLDASATTRVVTIALDAAQETEVKVGDQASITLPDGSSTPGVVSSVGSVATAPSGASGGASPTITVLVTPTEPSQTGQLDQAPVNVLITEAQVTNALVVPVDSLLALSGGGYAVEEVRADGTHQLVPVSLGIFDDAAGVVQVSGAGLAAGQRVVVPST